MAKVRSVKFNALMNMIVTASAFIFPLITVPYVSRVLSTYGTGEVAFAQSLVSYFCTVALFGVTYYGVTACAGVRDDPDKLAITVKELLIILGVLSTACTIVYYGCIFFIPRLREDGMLFAIFGVAIWLSAFGVEWFYQALEQYGYITARSVAFKFLGLILMLVFVRTQKDYVVYGAITVISGYGSNVFNMLRLRKLVNLRTKGKLNIRQHLRPMLWYGVASVSSGLYTKVDMIALGFLGTGNMLGLYQLATKVETLFVTAINSVGGVLLPRMAYYRAKNRDDLVGNLVGKNFNFVGIAAGAVIGASWVCSEEVVLLLGGADFAEAALPLRVVVPASFFSAMNIVLAYYLMTYGREKDWAITNLITSVASIVYQVVLIPWLGAVGAGVGLTLTEATAFVLRYVVLREVMGRMRSYVDMHKAVIAMVAGVALSLAIAGALADASIVLRLLIKLSAFCVVFLVLLTVLHESFFCTILKSLVDKVRTGRRVA